MSPDALIGSVREIMRMADVHVESCVGDAGEVMALVPPLGTCAVAAAFLGSRMTLSLDDGQAVSFVMDSEAARVAALTRNLIVVETRDGEFLREHTPKVRRGGRT